MYPYRRGSSAVAVVVIFMPSNDGNRSERGGVGDTTPSMRLVARRNLRQPTSHDGQHGGGTLSPGTTQVSPDRSYQNSNVNMSSFYMHNDMDFTIVSHSLCYYVKCCSSKFSYMLSLVYII